MAVAHRRNNTSTPKRKKTAAQQLWFLHWLMAATYFLLFSSGIYMADLPKDAVHRGSFYDFHKTLGVTIMSLLLARIGVLLRVVQHKYRRRLPKFSPQWLQTFVFHAVLYGFMLLLPLSGYLYSSWAGRDVHIFGSSIIFGHEIALPRLVAENRSLVGLGKSTHFWLAYTFLAAIVLHLIEQQKYVRAVLRRFYKFAGARLSR